MTEHRFLTASHALPSLMNYVLNEGEEVGSRAGRVMECLHQHIAIEQPWRRGIVVPGRKASLVAQIAETMWVLAGRNDVAWLSHYLPRAAEFSDDGKVWRGGYGPRIRAFGSGRDVDSVGEVDQLAFVVEELRRNPLSRRAVISIYDPDIDTQDGKDIPCNDLLVFSSRLGQLDLSVHTRSNDLMWGWSGINAFEWSALQEIVAGLLGIRVGELHFSIVSLHLYDRHWTKARDLAVAQVPELMALMEPAPRFDANLVAHRLDEFDKLVERWFKIEELLRVAPQNTDGHRLVRDFPEPMLRSWLQVIAWHWTGDGRFLDDLRGTDLYQAALWSPKRQPKITVTREELGIAPPANPIADFVTQLHTEKDAVYGDSWCKRGEQISILANMARKVDRLGVAGGGDSALDTVMDLLVYAAKYRVWLVDHRIGTPLPDALRGHLPDGHVAQVNKVLRDALSAEPLAETLSDSLAAIDLLFTILEEMVNLGQERYGVVDRIIVLAAHATRLLWDQERAGDPTDAAPKDRVDYQNPYRNIPEDEL